MELTDRTSFLSSGSMRRTGSTGWRSAAEPARCPRPSWHDAIPGACWRSIPQKEFIATARRNVSDQRAEFRVADAQSLPVETASRDAIASALALNFVPDRDRALGRDAGAWPDLVRRSASMSGTTPAAAWSSFTRSGRPHIALDPAAQELSEDRRFPFCTPDGLRDLVARAGLASVECTAIEIPTVFKDFDDYWLPFTWGAGPVPGYCASLSSDARQRLRDRLHDTLPRGEGGTIPLKARAWAVKAKAA